MLLFSGRSVSYRPSLLAGPAPSETLFNGVLLTATSLF